MPIYRKTSGGVFAPISALNINDGGEFKPVTTAWINDDGTFKQVFPNNEPMEAGQSGLYDIMSALGGMGPFTWGSGSSYSQVGWHSGFEDGVNSKSPRIPLIGNSTPVISNSVFRITDENGDIIQTATSISLTGTPNTSTADIILNNPVDEQNGILGYHTDSNGTLYIGAGLFAGTAAKFGDKSYPAGTVINMYWEWTIGAQKYYHQFAPYTLS